MNSHIRIRFSIYAKTAMRAGGVTRIFRGVHMCYITCHPIREYALELVERHDDVSGWLAGRTCLVALNITQICVHNIFREKM